MIKKISTILSLVLLISISSTIGVFADANPKRELIEGSIPEISTELNKRAFKDSKEVILVNEESIVDSISATPLAYAKNAPIVVTKSKKTVVEANKSLNSFFSFDILAILSFRF